MSELADTGTENSSRTPEGRPSDALRRSHAEDAQVATVNRAFSLPSARVQECLPVNLPCIIEKQQSVDL